jgi:hypothetical protein
MAPFRSHLLQFDIANFDLILPFARSYAQGRRLPSHTTDLGADWEAANHQLVGIRRPGRAWDVASFWLSPAKG